MGDTTNGNLAYAAANQLSIAILFVDLTKAFDLVLREVVLGWPQLPGIKGIEYLEELGFPADHARQLAAEIASDGCVFDEIRIHPHVRELVASMHTKSWFHVPGCSERLVTRKGSCPRMPFRRDRVQLVVRQSLEAVPGCAP